MLKRMDNQSWRMIGAVMVIAGLLFAEMRFIPPAAGQEPEAKAVCTRALLQCTESCDAAGDRTGCIASCIRDLDQCLALSGTADDGEIIFTGYDPLFRVPTIIVERGGQYYMDGQAMEKLRHPAMPITGLSLALKDRIGVPDNYFLIFSKQMEIYTNCEFGPCSFRRAIPGRSY